MRLVAKGHVISQGFPAFGRRGLTVNTDRAFAAKYSMQCLSML